MRDVRRSLSSNATQPKCDMRINGHAPRSQTELPFVHTAFPLRSHVCMAPDLDRFYPAQCLETGYDILFFWVARMAMMGIELTGKAPFETVYMHGLVRAADGTKMSKTKGNVIDPVETVDEFGADSLRYSLVTGVTPGQDIPLNVEKIESNKMFVNKLWNMCKFVVENALKDDRGRDDYDERVSRDAERVECAREATAPLNTM